MITERKDFSVIDCGFCCGPYPSMNEVNGVTVHPCPDCHGTELIIVTHKKGKTPMITHEKVPINQICPGKCQGTGKILLTTHPLTYVICEECKGVGTIDQSDIKEKILNAVENSVTDLLYYDRKEDEDLPRDEIEKALQAGTVTIAEMVERFKESLEEGVKE